LAIDLELIEKFKTEASRAGAKVLTAGSRDEAAGHISRLVQEKNIINVVKAHCHLADSIGLSQHLEKSGLKICETALVQWTLQLAHKKEVPLDEVAALIAAATGEKVDNDPEQILKAARKALKGIYAGSDLGITGADFGIAETGTVITLETEGNARLAAVLPRLHLTLLEAGHIVASLDDVAEMIKQTSGGIPGHKVPAFITYLTGRNTTADIPNALFARAQGPTEEYILLINEA
jgi:L-lactate dehydrogenase complex protein LldF